MKKWSTDKLLAAGVILVVVSIGFVFFVSIKQATSVNAMSFRIDHTHTVIRHVQELERGVVGYESGARGYSITGLTIFLEPYLDTEELIAQNIKELSLLIQDNSIQQERLRKLKHLIDERIAFSNKTIKMRQEEKWEDVVAFAKRGQGQALMDSIQSLCGDMIRDEEKLLTERREYSNRSARNLYLFLYCMLGLVLTVSLIAIRQIRRRIAQQETNEKKFAALLDAAPDATIIVDRSGNVRMVNQQVINLFGYDRSELIGQTVESLIPTEARHRHTHHRDLFFEAPRVRDMGVGMELHAVKKDGTQFPVEISLSPIQTEEGWWVSASVRDITRRKKMEQTLKKANEELEAFTYSVSHDLRAPLRGIIGFASILEEEYASKLDDEARRITGVIRSNTQKMGHLIDDLLTFSRTGRQELLKVPMEMQSLVNDVVQEIKQQYVHPSITVTVEELPDSTGDKNMIRQVWINLISNAIKYSAHKSEVVVKVGYFKNAGETVYFTKDNGTGFDNQYRDKLFRVFQRLHSAEAFEGTGVGLALVEKIISRHGGKVWAEGEVDVGASFYFSLPD